MTAKGGEESLKSVKITAIRRTCYPDLMEKYENPIQDACNVPIGDHWIALDAKKPEGFCGNAWQTLEPFVKALAEGGGNFYDGWMKDPHTALFSCNDGFRPVSFYLEVLEESL